MLASHNEFKIFSQVLQIQQAKSRSQPEAMSRTAIVKLGIQWHHVTAQPAVPEYGAAARSPDFV